MMMALRLQTTRLATAASLATTTVRIQERALSSQGTIAVEKLRNVLEEYRLANYTQELPTRFKKDVVKAARPDTSNAVALDGFRSVLRNIGVEDRLSPTEVKIIFDELGDSSGKIPVPKMVQIL